MTVTLPGSPLSETDYETVLVPRAISVATAAAANLRRVDDSEGRSLVGRNGHAGHYEGIAIPYFLPGEPTHREFRLRRDKPDLEYDGNGKPKEGQKYVSPPGSRPMVYFVPGEPAELLAAADVPLLIVEGEFKALAAADLARHQSAAPRFAVFGLSGCYGWKGKVGKAPGPDGDRRDIKGVIADFDRINFKDRRVILAFDADVATNDQVRFGRAGLARELRTRRALVAFWEWDAATGKGVDDHIASIGPDAALAEIADVKYCDWKANLITNKNGMPKALLANCMTALREAPAWAGVLGFNEFALKTVALKPPPWDDGKAGGWTDHEVRLTTDWLHHQGIYVSTTVAGEAAQAVSRDFTFHPVRSYLKGLKWDGVDRLDGWLNLYLGVSPSGEYSRTVGAKFLISAVARIFNPGCKADCILVLEGPQGILKSTALRKLAEPWFTDEISDLGSKDASMQVHGIWILELSELDAMSRPEVGKAKAFISRCEDRFRLPYGKTVEPFPRDSVFAGTVNNSTYLKDDSGARRFWPVACTRILIADLGRDKDQLWAEAVQRFRAGENWWLDTAELNALAAEEQAERYEGDAWDGLIEPWINNPVQRCATFEPFEPQEPFTSTKDDVTVTEVLIHCIGKLPGQWSQADMNRIGRCLRSAGFEIYKKRLEGNRSERRFRRKA